LTHKKLNGLHGVHRPVLAEKFIEFNACSPHGNLKQSNKSHINAKCCYSFRKNTWFHGLPIDIDRIDLKDGAIACGT
jgi:hypothetical protein